MKPKKIMVVEWQDSSSSDHWQDLDSLLFEPVSVISVGQVIQEDDKAISLALSLGSHEQVCATITIPCCSIIKSEVLPTSDPGPQHG